MAHGHRKQARLTCVAKIFLRTRRGGVIAFRGPLSPAASVIKIPTGAVVAASLAVRDHNPPLSSAKMRRPVPTCSLKLEALGYGDDPFFRRGASTPPGGPSPASIAFGSAASSIEHCTGISLQHGHRFRGAQTSSSTTRRGASRRRLRNACTDPGFPRIALIAQRSAADATMDSRQAPHRLDPPARRCRHEPASLDGGHSSSGMWSAYLRSGEPRTALAFMDALVRPTPILPIEACSATCIRPGIPRGVPIWGGYPSIRYRINRSISCREAENRTACLTDPGCPPGHQTTHSTCHR